MGVVKVQYSDTYDAQRMRIYRLPNVLYNYAMSRVKINAIELINNFQDGIKKNSFRLHSLKPETIKIKEKKGLPAPHRPLYAYGELEDKSYMQMLRLRKLKYGWKVYPSWAIHHSGKIKLRDLLIIHEYGKSFINRGGTITKIPPRPAFRKAYNRLLRQKRVIETEKVRKALNRYINTGNKEYFEEVKETATKDEIRILRKMALE